MVNDASVGRSAGGTTAGGIVLIILGVVALACPLVSGVAIEYLVGGVLLVAGLAQLFHVGKAKSAGAGVSAVIGGLLAAVAGILMILHPLAGLGFLTLLMAAYFIVAGIASIVLWPQVRGRRGAGWLLFQGLLSVVLGGLIWMQWPLSGAWAVGTLFGIQLIFIGWSLVALGGAPAGVAAGEAASA